LNTDQIRDRTIVETETETDTETSTTFVYLGKRYASPEPTEALDVPFASRVATIPATAKSSACFCIQSRIPVSTSTVTVVQPLTLAGGNMTFTSTVQELFTTQVQNTVTASSLTTTFTTSTTTATLTVQTCAPVGAYCDLENPGACCSQACANGQYYDCGGLSGCCISFG
jgi:hypothetical protein